MRSYLDFEKSKMLEAVVAPLNQIQSYIHVKEKLTRRKDVSQHQNLEI